MIQNSPNIAHFQEYFKVLRSRFWVIFTIFVLTVLSGSYVTEEVLPKIYSATSQIEIKPRGVLDVNSLDSFKTDSQFDTTTFQAEFEIIQSPKVLQPVIVQLGLEKKWAANVFKIPTMTDQEALGYLEGLLKVDFKRGTDIITITVSEEDPKEAADIANAIADSYKSMRDDEENERNNRGADSIRQQIVQQQAIVDDRRATVDRLREEARKKGISIDPRGEGTQTLDDTDLERRKSDLLAAKEDADSRRVLVETTQKLSDEEFVNTLSAMNREEKNIQDLRAEAFKLKGDIANLINRGYGQDNPSVLALDAELDTRNSQVKALIVGIRQALELDAEMADSRVKLLEDEVKDLEEKTTKDQLSDLGPFRDAEHEYDKQVSLLDAYNVHLKQVLNDSSLMESPVRMISRATPPEQPSRPNKPLNMAVSVLAGLFLGVIVAFLVEYLDTSVKTMADAESLLGLPVLTVIPNKGGPMPLSAQSARLPHAEGYRILRAKLDLKVQNGVGPSLTILSGGPGEGKSTTIYNVAVICAQAGQSVILVDCDLRRPAVHQMVNLSNDHGLADYLRGEGDVLEYIQQTALKNLHVLPAGEIAANDIGALTGDKVRNMLDELKQRYDIVLVDSPPVLGISDGSIIAREIDYVILVIQHRRYPREISLRAKRAIEEVHGNCVGMVLNCVAVKSDDAYYYYSNYGNYYKDKGMRKKKKKAPDPAKANGKPVLASSRKEELESDDF
jgi:capsular exopolysaccharide synthesis family protein